MRARPGLCHATARIGLAGDVNFRLFSYKPVRSFLSAGAFAPYIKAANRDGTKKQDGTSGAGRFGNAGAVPMGRGGAHGPGRCPWAAGPAKRVGKGDP